MFGYKQHTFVDDNGLVIAVDTAAVNWHSSKTLVDIIDKEKIKAGFRLHADKAYCSRKHYQALKGRSLKNGGQDKAVKDKLLNCHGVVF